MRPGPFGYQILERAARRLSDVDERPQWTRREERITRTPKDPCRAGLLLAETLDERRLANARFAGHQHELPARGVVDLGECFAESRKLVRTLMQLNGSVDRSDCWLPHRLFGSTVILYESKD